MSELILEGDVGFEITARQVREALAAAGAEPVDMQINSRGGLVTEGLSIFNAIRDHRRNGGKVNARVVGLAASVATYIPLAADSIAVEDNAVWMIHNPHAISVGDQNEMRKTADVLDGIASIIARAYAEQTGGSREEMLEMMSAETWLFGEDIVTAGFADSVVPAGDGPETENEAVAAARAQFEAVCDRIRSENAKENIEQIAAMLPRMKADEKPDMHVVDDAPAPAARAENAEEGAMDITALKRDHSEVFAEAVELGVKQERARVQLLLEQRSYDPENAKLSEVVESAVAEGKQLADIQTAINVAIRDGARLDGENAPVVATNRNDPEGATDDDLTDEEQSICSTLGISAESFKAQKEVV